MPAPTAPRSTPPQQPSLPAGLERLGRYGAFTAQLAAGRLRRKLTSATPVLSSPRAVDFMATMKGLPQKLGQHLSMKHDLYALYAPLLIEGAPVADKPLMDALRSELGDRAAQFAALSRIASASLAQVYQGHHPQAGHVAVKIQYPGIDRALNEDIDHLLRIARTIARWMPRTSRSDPRHLQTLMIALKVDLLRELDYLHEARTMTRFTRLLADIPGMTCPAPVADLSSQRVLTMTWIEGVPWLDALAAATSERQQAALERLARAWLSVAFSAGLLHADPHPGNILAAGPTRDPLRCLAVVDFGQVLDAPPAWWAALRGLIEAVRSARPDPLGRLFEQLGFGPAQVAEMAPILLPLGQILLRPFITPGPFDVASWDLGRELEALLLDQPQPLRLELPPRLVMLQRTFHGLFFYARRFDVGLDWSRLLCL